MKKLTGEYRTCKTCGKEFYVMQAVLRKQGRGKYCSVKCAKTGPRRTGVYGTCEVCGKEIYNSMSRIKAGRGKYCSIECQHEASKNGKDVKCDNCGKMFYISKTHITNSNFCSKECQIEGMFGDRTGGWCGGKTKEKYPRKWRKKFKDLIRERDGFHCQACGIHQNFCKRALSVHHIDRNKNNLDPENLMSLCDYCHSAEHLIDKQTWSKKKELKNV